MELHAQVLPAFSRLARRRRLHNRHLTGVLRGGRSVFTLKQLRELGEGERRIALSLRSSAIAGIRAESVSFGQGDVAPSEETRASLGKSTKNVKKIKNTRTKCVSGTVMFNYSKLGTIRNRLDNTEHNYARKFCLK